VARAAVLVGCCPSLLLSCRRGVLIALGDMLREGGGLLIGEQDVTNGADRIRIQEWLGRGNCHSGIWD